MQSRWKIYRCVLKSSLIHERGDSGKAASFRSQRRNRCSSHLWHARCENGLNISATRLKLQLRAASAACHWLSAAQLLWPHGISGGHTRASHSCLYGWRKRRIRQRHMTWKKLCIGDYGFKSNARVETHPLSAKTSSKCLTQFHIILFGSCLVGSMHRSSGITSLIHFRLNGEWTSV